MWHIDAEIITLLFLLAIITDSLKTAASQELKDKVLRVISFATVFTIVCDIAASVALMQFAVVPSWYLHSSLILYFISTVLICVLWFYYCCAVVQKTFAVRPLLYPLAAVPFLVFCVIALTNPLTSWLYKVNEGNVYSRGKYFFVFFAMFYGYCLLSIIYTIRHFKDVEKRTSYIMLSFPIIAGIACYLQQILPGYLLVGAGFTLVLSTAYMHLQKLKITRDNLTGLENRFAFMRAVEGLEKSKETGFVLSISIDDFRTFNASFGRDTGDALLKSMSTYLSDVTPKCHLFRYSDSFSLILNETSEEKVFMLAHAIVKKLSSPYYLCGVGYAISVSLSIVHYPLIKDAQSLSLMDAIDYTLLEAKKRGGGQVVLYSDALVNQNLRLQKIKSSLENAIQNQGFELCFQPIFDKAENAYNGAEALLRLYDDNLGFVEPQEFVPVAEHSGQIIQTTYKLLDKVCTILSRNKNTFPENFSISINFSVLQFMQQDSLLKVKSILSKHNILPNQIKIEISNNNYNTFNSILNKVTEFSDYGFEIYLDDFADNNSDLSNITKLPFSAVKLSTASTEALAPCRENFDALSQLLAVTGKKIIAQCVDTDLHSQMIQSVKCDKIQGYNNKTPMNETQLIGLFAQ